MTGRAPSPPSPFRIRPGGPGRVQVLPLETGHFLHNVDYAALEARAAASMCVDCPACGKKVLSWELVRHAVEAGDARHAVMEVMGS